MGKKNKKISTNDNRFEEFEVVDVTHDRKSRRRDRRKEKIQYDKAFKKLSIDEIEGIDYDDFIKMR